MCLITGEEIRVHADAEGTDEDLPVQQGDQDPDHRGQQGPLDHGREKVPAGRKRPRFHPHSLLFLLQEKQGRKYAYLLTYFTIFYLFIVY